MKKYGIWGSGTGKQYTKFGEWLYKEGINQQWVVDNTSINRDYLSKLSSDFEFEPNYKLMTKLISELKSLNFNVNAKMFWNCQDTTPFSLWLINNGISQEKLSEISGVNESTIKRIRETLDLNDLGCMTLKSVQQIIKSLEHQGYELNPNEFWGDYGSITIIEKEIFFTPLGNWLYDKDIDYSEFAKICDASTTTIKYLSEDVEQTPSGAMMLRIMKAVKNYDPEKRINDFWDI
ncbi:hypothetical protein [Paenibacillus sp. Root444D2]|uniref:hypothetical protein n=1 Tax=Paenibacillus sp. Root444D2 TaxID=1736538 RepID=UPI00070D4EEF|nr:hypothetical protein [Paenibacillus sp. Root444D2]KQX69263.1 hypothetical protein ASD40_01820 [Paenibacillus sp. Root444D2]